MEYLVYTEPSDNLVREINRFNVSLINSIPQRFFPKKEFHLTLFMAEVNDMWEGEIVKTLRHIGRGGRYFREIVTGVDLFEDSSLVLKLEHDKSLIDLHGRVLGGMKIATKGDISGFFRDNYDPHITICRYGLDDTPKLPEPPEKLLGWQGWINYFHLAKKEMEGWQRVGTFGIGKTNSDLYEQNHLS